MKMKGINKRETEKRDRTVQRGIFVLHLYRICSKIGKVSLTFISNEKTFYPKKSALNMQAQRAKPAWYPLQLHNLQTELLGYTSPDMHDIAFF